MVILPQNLSIGNGRVPGWSCILSVGVIACIGEEEAIAIASVAKGDIDGALLWFSTRVKLTVVCAMHPTPALTPIQL